MNGFSWAKVVLVLVILSLVNLVVPPIETVAGNKAAMQQMQPSDQGYVVSESWANSPNKTTLIYLGVLGFGLLIMSPEIKRAVKKAKDQS